MTAEIQTVVLPQDSADIPAMDEDLTHEDWCEDPNCTHRERP